MSFAAGVYTRLHSWVSDRDANIKITASRMDAEMDGFATGLSTCLLKDGSQTVTGNIPMATYKFTGLGAGTGAGESVRYEQVVLLSAGAAQTITRSAVGEVLIIESTEAGATSAPDFTLLRNSASPAANDYGGRFLFNMKDSGGNTDTFAAIRVLATTVTNASEAGQLELGVVTAGSFAYELALTGDALSPMTNDGLALGLSGTAFADLFLASGAVINFNAGDVTATHSSNTLTFAGATSGYVFNDGPVVANGGGTLGDATGDAVVIKGVTVTAAIANTWDAATLAAQADEIIDSLGSTKGNILWHNGTSWVVLAPP